MFTVLHRGPDGSETFYECETVTRFALGAGSVPPLGKFELFGLVAPSVPGGSSMTLEIEQPFGAIFVMNQRGATIAKYMS